MGDDMSWENIVGRQATPGKPPATEKEMQVAVRKMAMERYKRCLVSTAGRQCERLSTFDVKFVKKAKNRTGCTVFVPE